jgi:hypothetical protein
MIGFIRPTALALAAAMAIGAPAWAADPKPADDPDREEIVVTHSRLGPLSDWAQMQAHTAEYERLKAKFDPTTGTSRVDDWAASRGGAGPTPASGGFIQDSASAPTSPGVQAIKDAVVPP